MSAFALPTFFVIGAPKCGTTSLHHYLGLHPQISMSSVKEPWVFARGDYRERLSEYARLLDARLPARGESSAVYSMHPHFPGVPERIHDAVPEARLVYVVGDPIERAIAHHAQRLTDGTEQRDLASALADHERPDNVYVAASRYASQVRRYLDSFDASRLLIVDQDELRTRTPETLAAIFSFVGVDPGFRSAAFAARLNTREEHRKPTALGARLRGGRLHDAVAGLPLPAPVRDPLRRAVSRGIGRPSLSPELRGAIAATLAPEIGWLREFSRRDFSGWSV